MFITLVTRVWGLAFSALPPFNKTRKRRSVAIAVEWRIVNIPNMLQHSQTRLLCAERESRGRADLRMAQGGTVLADTTSRFDLLTSPVAEFMVSKQHFVWLQLH